MFEESQSLSEDIGTTESEGIPIEDIDSLSEPKQKSLLLNERFKSDTDHRSWLAKWTASVVTCWLAVVVVILVFNKLLELSDTVMSVLLGTTTLNVLGLSFIVLRGYFHSDEKPFL
jgi:hypothetical protein